MPLYIGVVEDNSVNRLYISSASIDDPAFEGEHALADCSRAGASDFEVAKTDLRILRNKLTNGEVPYKNVVVETEGA